MDDKTLADAVVALGMGKDITDASAFVRDPRVAMALMERLIDGELTIWRQAYDADSPVWIVETHLNNADGRDESLSRAIIEACVQALTSKDTAELPCCGSTSGVHLIGCQSDDAGRIHRPEREESDGSL